MDKKTEIELRPCPACGGTDLQVDYNGVYERHFVRCYNLPCHMQGPEIYGKEAAAQAWNELPRKVEALPDAQLDALEKLAGKASPGIWVYEEAFGGRAERWAFVVRQAKEESGSYPAIAEMVGEERTEEDAAFIAAANPAVVLALIAEVRHGRANDD
ncbi:Lar family restriction alleviation protein [uncultured Desulfovibrio sp.]|uniref:Lar family restriction alleviation protein n=1 Tax=uncultured Desulfovibrio sp. TaxID=167968 RepID=UPI002626997D|nr:Lar family restriction alleviation protein [uncultured Desulfovibrio sp.]